MPYCTSGSPQQKPGIADDVILTAAVIASLFPPSAAWIEPFIGALAGIITLHLPDLCSVDPEPDPGLSGPDILSIIALGRGPLTEDAVERYQQLVRRWAWLTFCQCSVGPQPSPPTFPAAPTGLPAINPPGSVGVGTGPCGGAAYSGTIAPLGNRWDFRTSQFCDQTGQPSSASLAVPIPAGAVSYQSQYATHGSFTDGNSAHPYLSNVYFYNSSGGFLGLSLQATRDYGSSSDWVSQGFHSPVNPIPAGAVSYAVLGLNDSSTLPITVDNSVSFFCGTGITPVTGQPVCCSASDPYTQGYLSQIMQLLTLIQRQLAPFAYVGGASHIGLTGNGVLTIPSLQGIKVTLTTQPGYVGEEFGSPLELFDVGWVAWGSPDGYLPREFISHNPQLSFPAKAEQYTRLGYSLNPGVVATIQELYAET